MFTPEQYREKAAEYSELAKQANAPNEVREFRKLEQSLTMLADNEQWLADNHDNLAINLDKLGAFAGAQRSDFGGRGAYPAMPGGGVAHAVEHLADRAAKGTF